MKLHQQDRPLAEELTVLLAPSFVDITVSAGMSERWDRPCVLFRWSGFADMLPEERFHRLVQAIPAEFRQSRLAGFIWLELAPGETVPAFLKLPRSEDVADQEEAIFDRLVDAKFFDRLAASLGKRPTVRCQGDFSETDKVLSHAGPSHTRDAKLLFIRHGVYCDCQVLQTVQPELAKLFAGAA